MRHWSLRAVVRRPVLLLEASQGSPLRKDLRVLRHVLLYDVRILAAPVCLNTYLMLCPSIIRKTAFVHHLKTRHRLHPNSQEVEEMHLPHDVAQAKIDSLKPMGRRVAKSADKLRQTYEPESSPSSPESSYGIVTPEHVALSLPATPPRSYTSSPMPMYNGAHVEYPFPSALPLNAPP